MRMRSDVPIGVSLSGGLDSTAIICSMARQWSDGPTASGGKLLAFSFESNEFDESEYIAATLVQTRAEQIRTETEPVQFWEEFDRVLWFHDEPVNSMTPLVSYKIAQLAASNDVKVLLIGQGADEILGGYSGYFERKRESLVQQWKLRQLWEETSEYSELYGGAVRELVLHEIVKGIKGLFQRLPIYGMLAIQRRRRQLSSNPLYCGDFARQVPEREYQPYNPGLTARLLESVAISPLPLYLRQEDRNSMAHSVEARVPFLDHRLVALAFSVPEDLKVRGNRGKILLRESMRGRIPEIVRTRADKMGFPVPQARWFRDELYEPMRDAFSSQDLRELGIFDVREAQNLLERHKRGEVDASDDLFKIAQYARWASLVSKH